MCVREYTPAALLQPSRATCSPPASQLQPTCTPPAACSRYLLTTPAPSTAAEAPEAQNGSKST